MCVCVCVCRRWNRGSTKDNDKLLHDAYASSLRLAAQYGIRTIAFSLISAGVFSGDRGLDAILGIAMRSVRDNAYAELQQVHLVCFTRYELREALQAANKLMGIDGTAAMEAAGVTNARYTDPRAMSTGGGRGGGAGGSSSSSQRTTFELPKVTDDSVPCVVVRDLFQHEGRVPLASSAATVADVKAYIQQHAHIPAHSQVLIAAGKGCHDHAPAAPLTAPGMVVRLVQRKRARTAGPLPPPPASGGGAGGGAGASAGVGGGVSGDASSAASASASASAGSSSSGGGSDTRAVFSLPSLGPRTATSAPRVHVCDVYRRSGQVPLDSTAARVGDIKAYIAEQTGIAPASQILIVNGKPLQDDQPAAPYTAPGVIVRFVQRMQQPATAAPAASGGAATHHMPPVPALAHAPHGGLLLKIERSADEPAARAPQPVVGKVSLGVRVAGAWKLGEGSSYDDEEAPHALFCVSQGSVVDFSGDAIVNAANEGEGDRQTFLSVGGL